MTRQQKGPLRSLTVDERAHRTHLSRSYTAPARHVARAKALLPVADGCRFTEAARIAGRRSSISVSGSGR
jgi:hypothetical protein